MAWRPLRICGVPRGRCPCRSCTVSPRRFAAAACLAVVPPVGWWAVLNAPLDAGLVPVPLVVLPAAAGLFAVLAWRDGDTGRFGACGLVATAAAATRWALRPISQRRTTRCSWTVATRRPVTWCMLMCPALGSRSPRSHRGVFRGALMKSCSTRGLCGRAGTAGVRLRRRVARRLAAAAHNGATILLERWRFGTRPPRGRRRYARRRWLCSGGEVTRDCQRRADSL